MFKTIHINSTMLGEPRDLFVHVPADYDQTNNSYPVLYVLDGELIFEYAAATIDFLSGDLAGRAPKMIVVGIPNTVRDRDMTITGEADGAYVKFIDFLQRELIPHIDSTHRTNSHRVLFGWSSGAGICLWMFLTRPEAFDGYLTAGAGVGQKSIERFRQTLSSSTYHHKWLYLSTEGTTPMRAESIRSFSAMIDSAAPKGLAWKCQIMEGEDHVSAMPKGLFSGIEFLYSGFRVPRKICMQGVEAVKVHYDSLSERYGFAVEAPVGSLNDAATLLAGNNLPDKAREILAYGLELHPKSASLWDSMGELHEMTGEFAKAKEAYQQACAIAQENGDRQLHAYELHAERAAKSQTQK